MFYTHMIHFQMFLMRMYPLIAFVILFAIMLLTYLFLRKKLYRSKKCLAGIVILLVIGLFWGVVQQYRAIKHDKAVRNEFGELVDPSTPFYKVTAGDETFYFMNPKEVNGRSMFYHSGRNIVQPTSVVRYTSLWAMDLFPVEVLEDFILEYKTFTMEQKVLSKAQYLK